MNKLKLAKQAQNLYEIEGLNAQQIADTLGISRRTVFNWRKQFKWKKYKIDFEQIRVSFPEKLKILIYTL